MKYYHRAEIETFHVLVALKFPGEGGVFWGKCLTTFFLVEVTLFLRQSIVGQRERDNPNSPRGDCPVN